MTLKRPPLYVGDSVLMRKPHPCGSDRWVIYRIGADIGIQCTGCQRRVMLEREVFYKRLKQIVQRDEDEL